MRVVVLALASFLLTKPCIASEWVVSCVFDQECDAQTQCVPRNVIAEVHVQSQVLEFDGAQCPIDFIEAAKGELTVVSIVGDERLTIGISKKSWFEPNGVVTLSSVRNSEAILGGFFGECEGLS